jgi:hypothetical protein
LIGIETSDPKNFDVMCKLIAEAGFTLTDITNDEALTQFVV